MFSYWEKKYWFPLFDYVIIGSGIVGLCSAIKIKEQFPKSKVVILERGNLPLGASTKNAGFACFGTIGELLDDLKSQVESQVIETIRMRWNGLKALRELVPDSEMGLLNLGGTELIRDANEFEEYESNLDYINSILLEATGLEDIIKIKGQSYSSGFHSECFYNKYESQLNPVLMIKYLIKKARKLDIELINNFELVDYTEGNRIELLSQGSLAIETKNLIFCTNAFTNSLIEGLDIIPVRNQVLVTEKLDGLMWKGCFHFDKGYIYFRNFDNRILLGGARNLDELAERTSEFGSNEMILGYLKEFLNRLNIAKDIKIEYQWSGIIATGKSKKPIVKKVKDNIYTAVRLGGMGVAMGAGIANDLINLIEN